MLLGVNAWISIPQFFNQYWNPSHHGLAHIDAAWFNAFVNTVFSSLAMVGLTVAVILDNTIKVEKSKKDRGMSWWVKFRTFRGDNRIEEFYTFPSNLNSTTTLNDPCKASIELQVEGIVKAPTDPSAFKKPKWIAFNRIENFKLSGGGVFDSQGTTAYKREGCEKHDYCDSLPIVSITTKDNKQFHVNVLGCKNVTFKHLTVSAPGESPNTDEIHIGRSDGVNVLNTEIKTGDDCVSIGDGSKNLVMNGVTCGPGHSINIGSLGLFKNEEPVDGVTVKNCTLTNTSNGVRIKSWPGAEPDTCSNIHFEDITVTNVSSPIIIDQK
ncbi:hypothetical protein GOBAR_DD28886 [Gossypium barbadense]|nr:hypothetical protein GOBAR_DD28886 [Gossypium barbadense]